MGSEMISLCSMMMLISLLVLGVLFTLHHHVLHLACDLGLMDIVLAKVTLNGPLMMLNLISQHLILLRALRLHLQIAALIETRNATLVLS